MLNNNITPDQNSKDIQYVMYEKLDNYAFKIPKREIFTNKDGTLNYDKVKKYRDESCGQKKFKLTETQKLLPNIINPNSPRKGLLIFFGTGVGKTCTAISIAEGFKSQVEKYGSSIYILTKGPALKKQFQEEIIHCTGNTYINDDVKSGRISPYSLASPYYTITSYKKMYNKTSGEKEKEKIIVNGKVKIVDKKDENGEVKRKIPTNQIKNVDHSLVIVDESQNVENNDQGGLTLETLNKNSKNHVMLFLTATPIKNKADGIISIINFLRPLTSPIDKDRVFIGDGYNMRFRTVKDGKTYEDFDGMLGEPYLRNMVRGYVSYLRGNDPLTFSEGIEIGNRLPFLLFSTLTSCFMKSIQLKSYTNVINSNNDNSFDTETSAISNFVFPLMDNNVDDSDPNKIIGSYGIAGLNQLKIQLRENRSKMCNILAQYLMANGVSVSKDDINTLIYVDTNKTLCGKIFNEKYISHFSTKFYQILKDIEYNSREYYDKERLENVPQGITFIYSGLVEIGIKLIQTMLIENGYLEYKKNRKYTVIHNTRCYQCNYTYQEHNSENKNISEHDFYPATFLTFIGKTGNDTEEMESKQDDLVNVVNKASNKNGRYVKFVLGSNVMNEGVTLARVSNIMILDNTKQNLNNTRQVIGRGIRYCKHNDMVSEEHPFAHTRIYKYIISLNKFEDLPVEYHNRSRKYSDPKNNPNFNIYDIQYLLDSDLLSTEEKNYIKIELKFLLNKKVEDILREEAIDCPLNYNGNVYPEDRIHDNCIRGVNCPAYCGYDKCLFKCANEKLNNKYYDPGRRIYKMVEKNQLDFTNADSVLNNEIENCKELIKEMYLFNYIYTLDTILKYVSNKYDKMNRSDIYDEFYVFKALDNLMPTTTNDFNNFKDTVINKFNQEGYLIYRTDSNNIGYYIFQKLNDPISIPLFHRKYYVPQISNNITLDDFLMINKEYINNSTSDEFEFDISYYDNKVENEIIGTVTNEFRIRESRPKEIEKKRELGIPSELGAVCVTAKNKSQLKTIMKKLNIKISDNKLQKVDICNIIFNRLLEMEKYMDNGKIYLKVPLRKTDSNNSNKYINNNIDDEESNISTTFLSMLPFPLNLTDRKDRILLSIQEESIMYNTKISYTIEKIQLPSTNKIVKFYYTITYIEQTDDMNKEKNEINRIIMKNHGAVNIDNCWKINIE